MTVFYSDTPSAQISPSYYQTLEDYLRQNCRHPETLSKLSGSHSTTQKPAPLVDYLSLVKAGNKELHRDWGIDLGLQFRPATYGILGLLPLHCENLLEALSMVLKFESLVHDLGTSTIETHERSLVFKWHPNFQDMDCVKPITESVVAGMQQFSSWLSGRPIPIQYLRLPAPCHHHWLNDHGIQLDKKIGLLEMHLNLDDLLVPISQADGEIKQALLTSAELMLEKKQPDWIRTLMNWFNDQLPFGECPLEQAAELLSLSTRSLQRRLKEKDLSYQQLLSNFRQNKAKRLLIESDMSILDISTALGFQEQSSFSNAFKAWFGCSPAEFIKQHRA